MRSSDTYSDAFQREDLDGDISFPLQREDLDGDINFPLARLL